MGRILRRESNIFERQERRRLAQLVPAGLIDVGDIPTIIALKLQMIFLAICAQVAEDIEKLVRVRVKWEEMGWTMWEESVEKENTLKLNYKYFLEIVEPADLQLGFLNGLNPHDCRALEEEYCAIGRRVWFPMHAYFFACVLCMFLRFLFFCIFLCMRIMYDI